MRFKESLLAILFLGSFSGLLIAGTHTMRGSTFNPSECVQTDSDLNLVTTGAVCGSGSGGSQTLAVTTGTTTGFTSVISSPTSVVNADQAMFGVSLQASATAFLTIKHAVTPVTSSLVLTSTHSVVFADASGGGITVTLPTAVGIAGRIYTIKRTNSGSNTVTIATTSSQTVDADTTVVLTTQYTSIDVVSDGSNWKII